MMVGEGKWGGGWWVGAAKVGQGGLTASSVVNGVKEENVQVGAEQIGQPPLPTGQAYQVSVRAVGRLSEPAQFDNIVLKTGADGTLVRLKDVGRSELGAEDYGSLLRFNGHDAVGVGLTQLPA